MSFLHAILCYRKSTDSVTFSTDSGVTSVRKYINSMRMRERLKPGPFSSSSSSLGLGTRLTRVLITALEKYEHSGTTQKEDVKKTPTKMLQSTHCVCTICIFVES